MRYKLRYRLVVSTLAAVVGLTSCGRDSSTPTEPSTVVTTPGAPPTPSPTPPATPSPAADSRRSFIWSETDGFTILENPPGVLLVSANSINSRGEAVGTMINANGSIRYSAFRWSPAGGFTILPTAGNLNSYATGLDDDGNAVGFTENGSTRNAVIWSNSRELRFLNVGLPFLYVLGANAGWAFGNSVVGNHVAPFRLNIATGQMETLPVKNSSGGGVRTVDRFGQAAGYDGDQDYGFGGTSDAVMWDVSGKETVVLSCEGKWDCFASITAVGSDGSAVGSVTTGGEGGQTAFRWTREKGIEYLTDLSGATAGVNIAGTTDDGSIVLFTRDVAFILKRSGTRTIISPPKGYRYVQPAAVNGSGQIAGMLF